MRLNLGVELLFAQVVVEVADRNRVPWWPGVVAVVVGVLGFLPSRKKELKNH